MSTSGKFSHLWSFSKTNFYDTLKIPTIFGGLVKSGKDAGRDRISIHGWSSCQTDERPAVVTSL